MLNKSNTICMDFSYDGGSAFSLTYVCNAAEYQFSGTAFLTSTIQGFRDFAETVYIINLDIRRLS